MTNCTYVLLAIQVLVEIYNIETLSYITYLFDINTVYQGHKANT